MDQLEGKQYLSGSKKVNDRMRFILAATKQSPAYTKLYAVTPNPDRRTFVNIKKISKKYQFLMVRFIKVGHPPRYSKI